MRSHLKVMSSEELSRFKAENILLNNKAVRIYISFLEIYYIKIAYADVS